MIGPWYTDDSLLLDLITPRYGGLYKPPSTARILITFCLKPAKLFFRGRLRWLLAKNLRHLFALSSPSFYLYFFHIFAIFLFLLSYNKFPQVYEQIFINKRRAQKWFKWFKECNGPNALNAQLWNADDETTNPQKKKFRYCTSTPIIHINSLQQRDFIYLIFIKYWTERYNMVWWFDFVLKVCTNYLPTLNTHQK